MTGTGTQTQTQTQTWTTGVTTIALLVLRTGELKNVNMTLLLHSFGISVNNIQVLMIFLTSYLLKANNKI